MNHPALHYVLIRESKSSDKTIQTNEMSRNDSEVFLEYQLHPAEGLKPDQLQGLSGSCEEHQVKK